MIGPVYVSRTYLVTVPQGDGQLRYRYLGHVELGWWDAKNAEVRDQAYVINEGLTRDTREQLLKRFPPVELSMVYRYEGPEAKYPYKLAHSGKLRVVGT